MPPSTADAYMIGKLGSYDVPTVAKVDAAIRELTAAIPAANQGRRRRIWADIDALLERRQIMTLEAAL
jgi:hypothetical protein